MDTLGIIEVLVRIAWLAGAVAFVLGLARMNSPATARNGNLLSAGGMIVAISATAILILARQLLGDGFEATPWAIILPGVALGGGLGLYAARTVKMTAMPQLVSLFNAVGGGAAALIAIEDYLARSNARSRDPARHQCLRRPRHHHRLDHLHRLAHRVRQAAGPDPGQADQGAGRPARDRWRWPS